MPNPLEERIKHLVVGKALSRALAPGAPGAEGEVKKTNGPYDGENIYKTQEFLLEYSKAAMPNLRERIGETNLSIEEFAKEAGFDVSYFYKIINQQRSMTIPMMKACLLTWKKLRR